jgi:hypothetical protein
MSREEERLKILELIDSGAISVEQGLELLNSLDETVTGAANLPHSGEGPGMAATVQPMPRPVFSGQDINKLEPQPVPLREPEEPVVEDFPGEAASEDQPALSPKSPKVTKWKSWWWIPMWVGVGITLVAAFLMYLAWHESGLGFWFACTWFPFLLGVGIMALAVGSRYARWIHIRVTQKPGEKPGRIAISLPIPLHLTAWFLRTFRHRIPGLENTAVDEVIMALKVATPETPFYVEVDEGEDGEHVEVYIG